jgi:general stress protein 26
MDENTKAFLKNHRISVLGVLQDDGVVHSATMHFASSSDPLVFFFMTEKNSIKCKSLQDKSARKASLVIGFNEEEMVTFQAEGEVSFLTEENKELGWETYVKKYPNRVNGKEDPDVVILQFIPSWARFSDYSKGLPVENLIS